MSLKLVPPRDGKSPFWRLRGTYLGQYIDKSTKARKLTIARKVMAKIEREIEHGKFSIKGEPTFASAAAAYMRAGGEGIYLQKLMEHFGDKPLSQLSQVELDTAASVLFPGRSPATLNRQVYTPVSAILRHVGVQLNLRRPRGSGGNTSTAWLWPEQAFALIKEAEKIDKEFAALLIVLLYTGMRLSEALGLTWDNVRLQDGFAYLRTTKNNEPRGVPLTPMAVAALENLPGVKRSARVFRYTKSGHLYSILRVAAIRSGVELPERSAFHIFRHTYATWMRRYAGLDTKGLVATGAWKDRKSADRYEHVVVSEEAQRAALLPTPERRA
jgi:integrase